MAMLDPLSSTTTNRAGSSAMTCSHQAARRSSSRSLAVTVFFSRPGDAPLHAAHRGIAHAHTAGLCPEGAVLIQRDVGVGRELGDERRVVRWRNTGSRARRSARGNAACVSALPDVPLDG